MLAVLTMLVMLITLAGDALAAPLPIGSVPADEAVASDNPAIPRNLSAAEVDRLLATMDDREARALLREALVTPAQTADDDGAHGGLGVALAPMRMGLQAFSRRTGARLARLRMGFADVPAAAATAAAKINGAAALSRHLQRPGHDAARRWTGAW